MHANKINANTNISIEEPNEVMETNLTYCYKNIMQLNIQLFSNNLKTPN